MKKRHLLTLLIVIFLSSCTSVEDRAKNVLENFSSTLKEIKNPETIPSYELSSQINQALQKLNDKKQQELIELTELKDKELFESLLNIESIEVYTKLREVLTNKNLEILENIKGKLWIDKNTRHFKSIFKVDVNSFSFLNLRNKFGIKILNGNIICDNTVINLDIKDKSLYLIDKNGNKREFQEPTLIEKVYGRYGSYSYDYIFKEKGRGYLYAGATNWTSKSNTPFTYSIKGNRLKVVKGNGLYTYQRNSFKHYTNKIVEDGIGTSFYRQKRKGPNSISYLIDGDYENPNKKEVKKIKVEYSNTSNKTSTDSKNWNKVLDNYEDYINEYIKYYKKAKNGDISALKEYPKLMRKAEELQKSLTQAQNDNSLTTKQISRMTKIQTKMLNALK